MRGFDRGWFLRGAEPWCISSAFPIEAETAPKEEARVVLFVDIQQFGTVGWQMGELLKLLWA